MRVGVCVCRVNLRFHLCVRVIASRPVVWYGRFFLEKKKRSEIHHKNFISNTRTFHSFQIKKCTKNWQVLFFLKTTLRCTLCFWTHTRTVQLSCPLWSHSVPRCTILTYADFVSLFLLHSSCACQFSPIVNISKRSSWFTQHQLDQM